MLKTAMRKPPGLSCDAAQVKAETDEAVGEHGDRRERQQGECDATVERAADARKK